MQPLKQNLKALSLELRKPVSAWGWKLLLQLPHRPDADTAQPLRKEAVQYLENLVYEAYLNILIGKYTCMAMTKIHTTHLVLFIFKRQR